MRDARPVAVCDTPPLQYLHQLGLLSLLPQLYRAVLVASAVADEIEVGRQSGVSLPDLSQCAWVTIRRPDPVTLPALPVGLGGGEREALALALATPSARLLTDDRQARRCADALGVRVSGTLGVLLRAKEAGLLRMVGPLLDELAGLGFRLAPETRRRALSLAGEGP